MNTDNKDSDPLSLTRCWFCQAPLFKADASNFQGHHAHHSCIFKHAATEYKEQLPPPDLADIPMSDPGWSSHPEEEIATGDPWPFGQPEIIAGFDPGHPPESASIMIGMMFPDNLVVDAPDAHNILNEVRGIAELLLYKNRAYGSSFARPLNVFSKLDPVAAIDARLDDKLARIKQSKDFIEDTEADIIGYLILKRIAIKQAEEKKRREVQPELCFDEQVIPSPQPASPVPPA